MKKIIDRIIDFLKNIIIEIFSNGKIISIVVLIIVTASIRILFSGFNESKVNDTFSDAEVNTLLNKYMHNEIKDDSTKIKFYRFINSEKGEKTLIDLKNSIKLARENKKINLWQEKIYNSYVRRMENTKIQWSPQNINKLKKYFFSTAPKT